MLVKHKQFIGVRPQAKKYDNLWLVYFVRKDNRHDSCSYISKKELV